MLLRLPRPGPVRDQAVGDSVTAKGMWAVIFKDEGIRYYCSNCMTKLNLHDYSERYKVSKPVILFKCDRCNETMEVPEDEY